MANSFQALMDRAATEPPVEKPKRTRAPRAAAMKTETATPPEGATTTRSKSYRPVRDGKRFVGAHFPPEVARQLKMLAAEDDTTVQELLEQAVDMLFVKHSKSKIADLIKK